MATQYTSLLGLALPVTGELSGTWGDTVNDFITEYLDAAVAGAQVISGSQTAVTLSTANGTSLSQAGSGSTGSSQYQIIVCTGNPAGMLTITAPAASKTYLILNNTSTNQSVKIVGTGPTTGVTVTAAQNALVACTGSAFELVSTTNAAALSGVLAAVNGGTGQSSYTTGDLLYASSPTAIDKLADVATGNALISGGVGVAPSYGKIGLTTHITGTLAVGNGGTGATSLTLNNVLLGNGTSALQVVAPGTNGNVLTSNGTTWTSAALPAQVYPGAGIAVSTGTAWGTSKASPTGDIVGTTDTQTLSGKTITNLIFDGDFTEEVFTITDGASVDLDPSNGTIQLWTLGAARSPTANSFNSGQSMTLLIDDGSAFAVTWPSVTWKTDGGVAPTLNTTGYTVIQLWKVSATLYGARVGDA